MKIKSKKWEVGVEWKMLGVVEVEADSEKEAMSKAVELVRNNDIEVTDIEDANDINAYFANELKQ